MEAGHYPERPGEPDCTYYLRTGLCRFGMTCKFNHPPNRKLVIIDEVVIIMKLWTYQFSFIVLSKSTDVECSISTYLFCSPYALKVVPHITDAIQEWIEHVAMVPVDGKEGPADVCVIELGGTIGRNN